MPTLQRRTSDLTALCLPLAIAAQALVQQQSQRARHLWRNMGLAPRMLAIVLALLVLMQSVVFVAVTDVLNEQAQRQIDQELMTAKKTWLSKQDQTTHWLSDGALLLASDFNFQSAMQRADHAAMTRALDDKGRQVGAKITALLDPGMAVMATNTFDALFLFWLQEASYPQMARHLDPTVSGPEAFAVAVQKIARQMRQTPHHGAFALIGGAPFQFVLAPLATDAESGWVLMGFPIDQSLIDGMHQLLSVHMAVISKPPGDRARVVASTLSAGDTQSLATLGPEQTRVTVSGELFETLRIKLDVREGEAEAVLLRSVTAVMAPFHQLQWTLAALTVVGLGLFGLASWRAMRQVTQPLRALDIAAQAVGQGVLDAPLQAGGCGDELGRLTHSFQHMRSNLQTQQAEIHRLAFDDRLTGLPNRLQFSQAVQAAVIGRPEGWPPLAVITLNLNRFKNVNRVLGYAVGDEVLRAVAHRLTLTVATTGMVARVGGDDFAILLKNTDTLAAHKLGERIVRDFMTPLVVADQDIDADINLGLACWPDDAGQADALISRAELAMQAAKRLALPLLRYTPALDANSDLSLSMLSDLRQALRLGELQIHLQPKQCLRTRKTVAAEALLRWRHPTRGMVSPAEFIPFAEQTGLIRELTLWVVNAAAKAAQQLHQLGHAIQIAINISARDLLDPKFPERVSTVLRQHGILPKQLCLEITESAIMDDPVRAEATLNALAQLGFKLSIDDFGTGYSSLAYLSRLPVSELKIDRSFVIGMASHDSDRTIIQSTIDLAHSLQLSVVAEGIEDDATLQHLTRMQCDLAQGYCVGRPLPLDQFLTALALDKTQTNSATHP